MRVRTLFAGLTLLGWICTAPEFPALAADLPSGTAPGKPAQALVAIPPDRDTDLKLYTADGHIVQGAAALGRMQAEAGLILWLAGNQFFAMDDVVAAFQQQVPGTVVGLITLPPGLIERAIEAGGWTYQGQAYPGRPDVYGSTGLAQLVQLKKAGLMREHAIYLHNELVLLVAKGNPKGIRGISDLGRTDVRTSMPNPVSEGIMQTYGRPMLERHGLWQHLSGGKECAGCQTTATNWFTAVHHRETPDRIAAGTSDTGLVWATEAQQARTAGKPLEEVRLPPEDSLREAVAYAIGPLTASRHPAAAARYLAFLATPEGLAAYARHGFGNATPQELTLRPIP